MGDDNTLYTRDGIIVLIDANAGQLASLGEPGRGLFATVFCFSFFLRKSREGENRDMHLVAWLGENSNENKASVPGPEFHSLNALHCSLAFVRDSHPAYYVCMYVCMYVSSQEKPTAVQSEKTRSSPRLSLCV